ncbi:2OG-Fe(II) oxygenase [Pelagibacteraceae bacterium]|nr:2OG-Fe(II) oxygenase [Pelagibacteraceae bacterium]
MLNINYLNLYKKANQLKKSYKNNKPFPHIYIDNFLSKSNYLFIKKTFPKPKNKIWKKPDNNNTKGKSVTVRGKHDLKELQYSNQARNVFFELNSGLFIKFIENLTGIQGLLPDPYFAESGFHQIQNNGYLNIHADFSHHDYFGLERRVNLLYYLNDDWKDDYNGNLSLYNKKIKQIKSYKPQGNRCIIFSTSDISYHGHPEKLNTPKGVYRKSIAMYYYTLPTRKRTKKKIIFPNDKNFTYKITKK